MKSKIKTYDPKKIEPKWQKAWAKSLVYKTKEGGNKPKCYILDMFPYPSGVGLHMGHPKSYVPTDTYSRYKKLNGFNVLHPMGWDAFGLPAENYAIKNKVHPALAVKKNIKKFKEQLGRIGFDYDWSREVDTTDPKYYKWTQWIFLKLLEKGLAFESYEPINWCPSCQTGLANEDLEDGVCERCGSQVEKKPMRQWVLRITDYADRLIKDLDIVEWTESIKQSQRNWIGKSEGCEVSFRIIAERFFRSSDFLAKARPDAQKSFSDSPSVTIFTTRVDTIFGATYLVLAPEHPLVEQLKDKIKNGKEVAQYILETKKKNEILRTAECKEKTGVILEGVVAINPANGKEIPVYIADYVLAHHGTGAIMAVPFYDERDKQFALKFDLPIVDEPLVDAKEIVDKVGGKITTKYKLKDWVFSRQRYWGEPIPVIHCEKCGVVPVPEKDLPVILPKVKSYAPTGTGESPLADIKKWVNTKCPKCKGAGKRETNTMPQWAGSSWYYLRFMDPKNSKALVDKKKEKYWAPVDMYVGGTEHATRHLIYARFWHKFLFDIGAVTTEEPFLQLKNQGLVLAEDGRKMSKRWGNVVDPDEMVLRFGADALRVYIMFMGPFENAIAWQTNGMVGTRRFIERVWALQNKIIDKKSGAKESREFLSLLNKTIKKVGEDITSFSFNTAISAMMILINQTDKEVGISRESLEKLLLILAPFAPHTTEEMWHNVGEKTKQRKSIHLESWPKVDTTLLRDETVKIAVQVNGRVRDELSLSADIDENTLKTLVFARDNVKKWTDGKEIKKTIYIKNKLMNIVIAE